jgi:hypothetical protein
MASNTTSTITIKSSGRYARGYVEAWVDSQTDTTATIYWRIVCQQKSAALYGQEAYGYVDGSQVGYCSGHIDDSSTDWKNVCSKSGYKTVNKTSGSRSVPVKISTRVTPIDGYGSVTTSWYDATCYVSISGITIYEPNAPSGLSNTRESDNKNVLAWTAPSTSTTKPVTAILIERSVDGGAWSQIASVSGTATSYNDTSTSADHSYAYRIRSQNSAGYSGYVTSGTTYNKPAAPTSITASRLAEKTVSIVIENTARTAEALELYRSTDGIAWAYVTTIYGSPVTETTDEPGGGTFYYRARNFRETADGGYLTSDYSPVSNAVVTICPPAAPTLVSPVSGAVISKAQPTLTHEHKHNSIDGSEQTAAQYRFSFDKGATYEYVDIDGPSNKLVMENIADINSEITWGVRTKGVHADFGPWSDNRVFYVRQAPSVAFTQPTDGFVVENTPISIQLQYEDPSGTLANATLTISNGIKTVYTRNMGTETTCEILATEWLPDNETEYVLSVSARSTSTLTTTATRSISVNFTPPQPALLHVDADAETGYANLVLSIENDENLEIPASISVYRVHDGEQVLLGEGLQAGAAVVDKFAPLNTDYEYIVATFANSGAANAKVYPAYIKTSWSFLYFKDDIARGMWNPDWSWDIEPSVEYIHYVGAEHPSAYMDDFVEEGYSLSVQVSERDEVQAFRRMMMAHQPVVAKLWRGEVFYAVPSISGKPKSGTCAYWGEVSVDLTRIAGDVL